MTLTTLGTTETVILERESIPKRYLISVAKFTGTLDYVLVRIGPGAADIILSSDGTTLVELEIPAGMQVSAWASAGTPYIATHAL